MHNDSVAIFSTLQQQIIDRINKFSEQHFLCYGGRIGSGMGGVLEALYLFNANQVLCDEGHELALAWIADHQYNDFVCVDTTSQWIHETGQGELFMIEVKSMISAAVEAKAHFDQIVQEMSDSDQLLVIAWSWRKHSRGDNWVSPVISEIFLGSAVQLAYYRDALHIARGGDFVNRHSCPDKCVPEECKHHGEPLNSKKGRERSSGPNASRPSASTSFSANFGGLKRMLAARAGNAKGQRDQLLAKNETARLFVDFMVRNFGDDDEADSAAKDE